MANRNPGSTSTSTHTSTVSALAPSTVTGINSADGQNSEVVTRCNLSTTSAEFHPAMTLNLADNNSGPSMLPVATNVSSAAVVTTVPDSPSRSPFFRS